MIQFIKFQCISPVGVALVRIDHIVAILPSDEAQDTCILHLTTRADFLAKGNSEFWTDTISSLVGSEWNAVPEVTELGTAETEENPDD